MSKWKFPNLVLFNLVVEVIVLWGLHKKKKQNQCIPTQWYKHLSGTKDCSKHTELEWEKFSRIMNLDG